MDAVQLLCTICVETETNSVCAGEALRMAACLIGMAIPTKLQLLHVRACACVCEHACF